MATREQCEAKLQERFKTREDIEHFFKTYTDGTFDRLGHYDPTDPRLDAEHICRYIRIILDRATRKRRLDQLGTFLEIPTDVHQQWLETQQSKKLSKQANCIAAGALIVSLAALAFSIIAFLTN